LSPQQKSCPLAATAQAAFVPTLTETALTTCVTSAGELFGVPAGWGDPRKVSPQQCSAPVVSIPQLLLVPAETCEYLMLDDGLPTVARLPQHEMAALASMAQTWSEPALIDTKDWAGTTGVGTDKDRVVGGRPI
jgi:hypothetical protein